MLVSAGAVLFMIGSLMFIDYFVWKQLMDELCWESIYVMIAFNLFVIGLVVVLMSGIAVVIM